MNKPIIIGNLTRDPELRYTQGDNRPVCNFDVAVNDRRNGSGQQEVTYFRVTAWDNRAETCKQYLSKGKKVCVSGPVSARPWQSERDGTLHAELNVTAHEVEFLSSAGDSTPAPHSTIAPSAQRETQPQQATMFPEFTEVETNDLPF